jgi:TatD DNase family protein
VLARARDAGIGELVVIASDPEDAERARAAAESAAAPRMWWTAGLHPHVAERWSPETRLAVEAALDRGAVAVGETGIDHHYDHGPREAQARAFAGQLALAVERDLPVVVHSREAEAVTLSLLEASGIRPERVVLHCFTGSTDMLDEAVARGYHVSFSGIVTFPRFPGAELAARVPEERLLVETDAPYLAPVPHRGRRNEPAFVADTVAALAAFRGVPPAALAERTRVNALRFYRLDAPSGALPERSLA